MTMNDNVTEANKKSRSKIRSYTVVEMNREKKKCQILTFTVQKISK